MSNCGCRRCLEKIEMPPLAEGWPPRNAASMRFIVCPICGNKRCPKASYHDYPCNNSNEPGQQGSDYA